jgi:hypothetical protein
MCKPSIRFSMPVHPGAFSEESTPRCGLEVGEEMSDVDVARSAALNEQELWRDMVRWSGGLVHEEDGLLFVAGPSRYLRVVIRLDGNVDGAEAVRRAGEFFAACRGRSHCARPRAR